MRYHSTLQSHYSKADRAGNCYWAFRYICHKTGKVVEGRINGTGGESNINAIRLYWNDSGKGWDSGFLCQTVQHGIREFDRMVKLWPHAGCDPEQLVQWIKNQLKSDPLYYPG